MSLYPNEGIYRPSSKDINRLKFSGAMLDLSNLFAGRPVEGLVQSMPQQAVDQYKQDLMSQHEMRLQEQAMSRQSEIDALNARNIESQIAARTHDMNTVPGAFSGNGIEAQMLNIVLDDSIPDSDPRKVLARQRLQRPVTTVTPSGTYIEEGYNLSDLTGSPVTQTTEPASENPPGFVPKKPTDGEKLSAGFYDRMISAESELARLGDYDPTTLTETVRGRTNATSSKEKQQYNQASSDWIRAKLRKESGAVIGDEEMKREYETYFPIFGDSAEVIAQKARARVIAQNAMATSAGINPEKDTSLDGDLEAYIAKARQARGS